MHRRQAHTLKLSDFDIPNTGNSLCYGDKTAEIDALSEREQIGMEKSFSSMRKHPDPEHSTEFFTHMVLKLMRMERDSQGNLQRHIAGRQDNDLMPDASIGVQTSGQFIAEPVFKDESV